MFERLANDVAGELRLSSASVMSVLTGLLGLFSSRATGGLAGVVEQFRRAGLGETATSWLGGHGDAGMVTAFEVESALGSQTIERLAVRAGISPSSAGTAAAALLPPLVGELTADGVLPSPRTVVAKMQSLAPEIPLADAQTRALPRWLPWAGVAAVAMLVYFWPRPSPGTVEPRLSLTNVNGRITYGGVVKDDATRRTIGDAFASAFGPANISGDLQVDSNVRAAPWMARINDVAAALRVPGVEFSLDGRQLSLGGWLSSGERQAVAATLGNLFGAQAKVSVLADRAGEMAREANARAETALAEFATTTTATGAAIVQAMNLAVIDFPPGSADLPQQSSGLVTKSAEALKRAPKGTRVQIAGHTDSFGDPRANLALSQARAESISHALVAAGVNPAMLTTAGYGDTKPRESNATESGRFQNRRIEYTLIK